MTSWYKWTERKPTEADARGNYIEWHDSTTGARFIQPSWYSPYVHATGMYWRTPTPLPGEESAARHCGCRQKKGCFSCGMESGPAVADSPGAAPSQEGAVPAAAGLDAVPSQFAPIIERNDAYWLRYYVGQAMVFGAGGTPEDVAAHALKDALATLAAVKAQEGKK
jgi:hypothetical protein